MKKTICMLLACLLCAGFFGAAAKAADEGSINVSLTYDDSLCSVRVIDGNYQHDRENERALLLTGNGQSASVPEKSWLIFEMYDIKDGYRIKSVTLRDRDVTDGVVSGAYGGISLSNVDSDCHYIAELEPVPEQLPSVVGVTIYTDREGKNKVPDQLSYAPDDTSTKLYGISAYSDGAEYPLYFAKGQWQYSTDGVTWNDTRSWGSARVDFWAGWGHHQEINYLTDSYDMRLMVNPRELYTSGDPVYSDVIHVNGGASGHAAPAAEPRPEAPAAQPAAEEKLEVVPSSQKLSVDGVEQSTEIYNINGSNYFKLRDMAALLDGTGSRFSVSYDDAAKRISVTTGEAYTAVGGELSTGTDKSDSTVMSSQSIQVNGEVMDLTAYNIGGNNFFKLRELGEALGFDVDYDEATRTMLVTSR